MTITVGKQYFTKGHLYFSCQKMLIAFHQYGNTYIQYSIVHGVKLSVGSTKPGITGGTFAVC